MATFTFFNIEGTDFPDNGPVVHQILLVGGATGVITDVKIILIGVTHTFPDDLDMMLEGPNGSNNLVFWSDVGASDDIFNKTFEISDSAPTALPATNLTPGEFKPTDNDNTENDAYFGSSTGGVNHAAPGGASTLASAFNGLNPNGIWTLYLKDDTMGDSGSLARWALSITTSSNAALVDGGADADTLAIDSASPSGGFFFFSNLSFPVFYSGISSFAFNGFGGNDTFVGGLEPNVASGGDGDDVLSGGGGVDVLSGDNGADTLSGGVGNDTLDGGLGIDALNGGPGDNSFVVNSVGDGVVEAAGGGTDRVDSPVNHALRINVENLLLTGAAAINGLGNTHANSITGNSARNTLLGASGNDALNGGGNNDVLIGGLGKDALTGGAGNDRLDFNTVAEIGRGTTRDVVAGFQPGLDDIDLASIDATGPAVPGHTFSFLAVKGAAFTGAAGQLRWFQQNPAGTANDKTIIEGDINGNGVAEFQIELAGLKNLTAGDFVL